MPGSAPDRLSVVGDGAVEIALRSPGVAAFGVGRGIFWIEPDNLGEVGDGAVDVAFDLVAEAAREIGICKFDTAILA